MDCDCTNTKIVRRTIRGGSLQYVRQCQACGDRVGNPVARSVAVSENGGVEPPMFDEGFRQRMVEAAKEQREKEQEQKRDEFFSKYDAYLASADWRLKRAKVIKRCGGICEGCGDAKVVHVHHLTYKHVFNELLFELVGLCEPCHERAHEERDE